MQLRNWQIGKIRKKGYIYLCNGAGNGSDLLSGLWERLLHSIEDLPNRVGRTYQ
jgi:hypothetical protein